MSEHLYLLRLPEVSLHQLLSDSEAQDSPLNYRVVIMESGIDPRVFDFVHQVGDAGEGVRVISDQAIHGKCEVLSTAIPGETFRDRARHAALRPRIPSVT